MMHQLKVKLATVVRQAEDNPGITQQTSLDNGVEVDVLIQNGQVQLRLSQVDRFPSIFDYYLVLDYWPTVAERPAPKAVIQGRIKVLEAQWPAATSIW